MRCCGVDRGSRDASGVGECGHHIRSAGVLRRCVQQRGERVTVWRLTNFAKPLTNLEGKEILSEKSRTTVDCASGKLANSQVMRFAGKDASGDILNNYETPLRFTTVAAGSVDAQLVTKLCVP